MTGIDTPVRQQTTMRITERRARSLVLAAFLGATCAVAPVAAAQAMSAMGFATLGDFSADGMDDVLLRHEDGTWYSASMDGPGAIPRLSGRAYITDDPDWRLAAAGDFDGDGYRNEVLLRHADGRWRYYWLFNRWGEVAPCAVARLPSDLAWRVAGVGDLDSDGGEDLLLRHDDGKWHFVSMQCDSLGMGESAEAQIDDDPMQRFAALADFDGDGFRNEVLLRHRDGSWSYFPMNGAMSEVEDSGLVGAPSDLAWRLAGVGDLNQDGRDDLLLRHKSGRWLLIAMNGAATIAAETGPVGLSDDHAKGFAAIGDLDGDGFDDDVLLRHEQDGSWHYYGVAGTAAEPMAHRVAGIPGEAVWRLAGAGLGLEEVEIPDPGLRAVVAEALGAFDDADGDGMLDAAETIAPINARQMKTLENLIVPAIGIRDLTGLEHAENLSYLYLDANEVSDLQPLGWLLELSFVYIRSNPVGDVGALAGLPRLTELVLQDAGVVDVLPLAALPDLTQLQLDSNAISDIAALAALTKLRELTLTSNAIEDIGPLAALTDLQYLHLGGNAISDLTPLRGLGQLVYLDLDSNAVTSIGSLAGLENLTDLDLAHNAITDISALSELRELTYVYLDGNAITDLTPLAGHDLTHLSLSGNGLTDIAPLATTTFGGTFPNLDLSANNIADISALGGKFLWSLDLAANDIADLGPLADLPDLRELAIESNPVTDLSPLALAPRLRMLSLGGMAIEDFSPLAALGELDSLSITDSAVADLAAITDMLASNLITLELLGTGATDLGALAGPGFEYLNNLALRGNGLTQLPALGALVRLESLDVEDNAISDLAPLADATRLTNLAIGGNPVADLSSLQAMAALKSLAASDTMVSDIGALAGLAALGTIRLDDAEVSSIAALASLRGAGDGISLSFARNMIADLSPLLQIEGIRRGDVLRFEGNPLGTDATDMHIPTLRERGAMVFTGGGVAIPDAALRARLLRQLGKSGGEMVSGDDMLAVTSFAAKAEPFWWRWDVAYTPIRDLSGLEAAQNLTRLHLDGQRVADISALAGLAELADVRLMHNRIEDIAPLVANEGLGDGDSVQLRGNPLNVESIDAHIPALEARGVMVHW